MFGVQCSGYANGRHSAIERLKGRFGLDLLLPDRTSRRASGHTPESSAFSKGRERGNVRRELGGFLLDPP